MATGVDDDTRLLVVTGPARDELFERFSRLFYGRADVAVVKDRRYSERRAGASSRVWERRESDRRRRVPDWIVPPGPVVL